MLLFVVSSVYFPFFWTMVNRCVLIKLIGAEVLYMNMTAYNEGRLQSSFWIVDKQHVYIGSASLDWRSLGQVILLINEKLDILYISL